MFADLQYLQDQIQLLIDADNNTPAVGTDDWDARTAYINQAVHRWENVDGVWWRELWTTLADAASGDDATVAAQTTYDTPTDFRFAGGFVRITGSNGTVAYYPVLDATENQLRNTTTETYAYFTGNTKTGYSLHLNPAPTENGLAINYDYYKRATELSDDGDVIEMANPSFAVNYGSAIHYRNQRDLSRYSNYLADAEEDLLDMQIRDQSKPPWQDDSIPDLSKINNKGFGS